MRPRGRVEQAMKALNRSRTCGTVEPQLMPGYRVRAFYAHAIRHPTNGWYEGAFMSSIRDTVYGQSTYGLTRTVVRLWR